MEKVNDAEERRLKAAPGMLMLFVSLIITLLGIPAYILGGLYVSWDGPASGAVLTVSILAGIALNCIGIIMLCGLKIIHPNEALVLTLFGNYYGTLYDAGFYWVNPFCTAINPAAKGRETTEQAAPVKSSSININMNMSQIGGGSKKVSLKTMTLDNKRQKVNDAQGNPVEIGTIVIWKVKNATKAVLNVENYTEFLSIQCDAITRNAARNYPYDTNAESDEKTLRGSSQEIADIMQAELQNKVMEAGLEILDVRITHLAYAPEIASAMLQRQQAAAVIDARQKIVEGAVSMVEMALHQLSESQIVELDEERKAAMVSNLLVVLCGNKDAQPVVNSGSIY
ncbi:MAG TPA: SPFH domain-containing protein [Candidatus Blautia excrementipullorum]|nr:SPFH domain-containing protein [Candidatus Blautia excrementipullorum]